MTITKKILSLVITFVMLAQTIFSLNAAAAVSSSASSLEDGLAFLNAVGIVEEQYEEIALKEKITRLDFALAVARIFSTSSSAAGSEVSYYSDMESADLEAIKAVNMLSDLKIISGSGNGLFNPYDNISYEQAIKMMVCALGYEIVAQQNGGYPYGYFAQGTGLGITDGITLSSSDAVNWESFIRLLTNSLFVDLMTQTGYGDEPQYGMSKNSNLLNSVMDIYLDEDASVTANAVTSVDGSEGVGAGYVEVNKLLFEDPSNLASAYIGKKADIYYTEDKSGKRTVIYVDADYESITISLSDISEVNGYRITYYDEASGEDETINISADATMLYNDQALLYTPSFIDTSKSGVLTFERPSSSSAYTFVVARIGTTMFVAAVDYDRGIVYDKLSDNSVLDLGSYISSERYAVIKAGSTTDINGIDVDSVITVYETMDKSYITINVSNSSVTGKITSYANGSVFIDDVEYKCAGSIENEIKSRLGSDCTVYTDEYGKIVWFTADTTQIIRYGYFVDAAEKSGLDTSLKLRVLTHDNGIVDYDVASKVIINGVSEKDDASSGVKALLSDGSSWTQQLVQYALNADGEIRLLNTVTTELVPSGRYRYEDLNCYLSKAKYKFKSGKKSFAGRVSIDSNTKIFVVSPNGSSDIEDYQIKQMSYFSNDVEYTIAAYNIDDGGKADALVCWNEINDVTSNYNSRMVMVDYITSVMNEDGEAVQMLYGLSDGKYVSYYTDGDVKLTTGTRDLRRGDVVRLAFNSKSQITYISLDVNIDTQKTTNPSFSSFWTANWAMSGVVYSRENEFALVSQSNSADIDSMFATPDFSSMYSITLPTAIMIYDEERDAVYPGTANDILTYKTSGADASRFFMKLSYETANQMFIFKYKD